MTAPNQVGPLDLLNMNSGRTATSVHILLTHIVARQDAIEGILNENVAATTAKVHNVPDNNAVSAADAVAGFEAGQVALANALKAAYGTHIADTNEHDSADATNTVSAADATDEATAITLANELKADYNGHRTQGSVHANNDTTNIVTSADATDEASLVTLLNELKSEYNAHVADAIGVNVSSDLQEVILKPR